MFSYNDAEKLFNTARNKNKGKPLDNNTRLYKRDDGFAIRLHDTDIVTITSDDCYILNTGGWQTRTTKERINNYAPGAICQSKGVWFYIKGDIEVPYFDGMTIDSDGFPINKEPAAVTKQRNGEADLKNRIKRYAKAFRNRAHFDKLPDSGDCWHCRGLPGNNDHLLSHIEEEYFVPTLGYRALAWVGRPVPSLMYGPTASFERALIKYLTYKLIDEPKQT